jgi:hypothetical protein
VRSALISRPSALLSCPSNLILCTWNDISRVDDGLVLRSKVKMCTFDGLIMRLDTHEARSAMQVLRFHRLQRQADGLMIPLNVQGVPCCAIDGRFDVR